MFLDAQVAGRLGFFNYLAKQRLLYPLILKHVSDCFEFMYLFT